MVVWTFTFQREMSNDAIRVAGGGIFIIGYPLWLAYATWRKPRVLASAPRPLVQVLGLIAGGLATVVLGLPALFVWLVATVGPFLGDQAYFLTVTNATDVPVLVEGAFVYRGLSSLGPGAIAKVSWGSHGRFIATTVDGKLIYCRDISTYDRLRQRGRVTITRDTAACSGLGVPAGEHSQVMNELPPLLLGQH